MWLLAFLATCLQAQKILDVTPVSDLIRLKWQTYGSYGFSILFLLNAIFVTLLSLAAYYRPMTYSECPAVGSDAFDKDLVINYTAPSGEKRVGCMPLRPTPFKVSFALSVWPYFGLTASYNCVCLTCN